MTRSAATGSSSTNSLKKCRPGNRILTSRILRSRPRRIRRLLRARPRQLRKPLLAHEAQIDDRRQRAEALVRADIGHRLLAADVLLARLERQDEALPALGVDRAPDDRGPASCARTCIRVAMNPRYGPPNDSGIPRLCPSPTTMSAPISPGVLTMPSEIG